MELDELKNVWITLDNKLQKNEKLNERLIREILERKSGKALNRLINFEWFGIIVFILATPVIIWLWGQSRFDGTIAPKILFVWVFIHVVCGLVYTGKSVMNLMKIDFTKDIKLNTEIINRLIIKIKKEKQISIFLIIPVYYILGAISYYELHANLSLWTFMITIFIIGILGTYWQYDRYYASNIQTIKRSLDELKELQEE